MATPKDSGDDHTGIEGLRGSLYSYGTHDQVAKFMKTTEAIAEYTGTTYKHGKEMWTLIQDKQEPTFTEPSPPADDKVSRAGMEKYKMLLRMYIDEEKEYKRDKAKVFRVIMSQCMPAMKHKVESLPGYKQLEKDDDVIQLLNEMKELVYSTDKAQYTYWTMQATLRRFINLKQDDKESLTDFHKRFLAQQEVTESVWGKMIPSIMSDKKPKEQAIAREKYLACLFLAGVTKSRFKDVVDDLNNDFVLGKVTYPADTSAMLTLLSNRRGGSNLIADALRDGMESEGTAFAQEKGKSRTEKLATIKCFVCGKMGHYANNCPDNPRNAEAVLQQAGDTESDDDSTTQSGGQLHF